MVKVFHISGRKYLIQPFPLTLVFIGGSLKSDTERKFIELLFRVHD